ncbi:MAG: glycine cleavage system protein H [Calditrichia bacterium]|nr:glycine cleavage system protein H [Calditrichia bacterium]
MEGFTYVDLYATKGIEYILVLGFLIAFIIYWKFLSRSSAQPVKLVSKLKTGAEWFHLPKNIYYHPGHSWVKPENDNIARVGIDDFAQKLLGKPDSLELPELNFHVEQGEVGWRIQSDSKLIDILSPVDGEVIAVNEEVLKSPELIEQDPYGKGWLLKVQVSKMRPNLRNLLSGKLAVAWMENTVRTLRERMAGDLGLAMQDGGLPVSGFAKEMSPEKWDEVAAEFLLTK